MNARKWRNFIVFKDVLHKINVTAVACPEQIPRFRINIKRGGLDILKRDVFKLRLLLYLDYRFAEVLLQTALYYLLSQDSF